MKKYRKKRKKGKEKNTRLVETAYRVNFAINNAFATVSYDRCYLLDDHSPDNRAEQMFLYDFMI